MKWLSRLYWYLREQWTLSQIYNAHLAAGSQTPWLDTTNEVHYRAFVIEAFRDEASEAYLHNGQHLDDSKKAFIKANLGPKTSIYDRQVTAMLRGVINGMTAEDAFHPEALERYNDEIDAFIQDVQKEHKRVYGKNGHHPLVTRVLRGKA
jgi:hypothetical protein